GLALRAAGRPGASERDDALRHAQRGERLLLARAGERPRLLLRQLQHRDVAQERRVWLGLELERPAAGGANEALAVKRKLGGLRQCRQRLLRELATEERADVDPVGFEACDVGRRPPRAELANV